jgi:hypothetical protein
MTDQQMAQFVNRYDRGEITDRELAAVMSEHQVSPLRFRQALRRADDIQASRADRIASVTCRVVLIASSILVAITVGVLAELIICIATDRKFCFMAGHQ